jgi:hypothetical protein
MDIEHLLAVEKAALELDAHRNDGYASVVSYMIRLHEALWGSERPLYDSTPVRDETERE